MLEIVPMTLKEANAFVEQKHRHHGPVTGHKFSIGLSDGEKIVGVAIVGRPVARHLDDGWTLEVNRLCTDGSRNRSAEKSTKNAVFMRRGGLVVGIKITAKACPRHTGSNGEISRVQPLPFDLFSCLYLFIRRRG